MHRRQIKGEAAFRWIQKRSMDLRKPLRHKVQRIVPAYICPVDLRAQQPFAQANCLAQRRAFGTQPPKVRRMVGIAPNCQPSLPVRTQQNPAPHTTIGAGGLDDAVSDYIPGICSRH